PVVTDCGRDDIRVGSYAEVIGTHQGDLSSSRISGRERLSPRDTSSARQFGGGGSGGGNTGRLGETSTSFGVASTRVLDSDRWGSTVGASVIGSGYSANHATDTTQPRQPPPPPPQPLSAQLRPGEQLRSPDRSSAETMFGAPTSVFGDVPLSGSDLAAPPRKAEQHVPLPGSGPSVTPHVGMLETLGVAPPTMLAKQPLEVQRIGLSPSPATGETGVP
ncbi:unnamed protein product, partial [Laminaria digitata]